MSTELRGTQPRRWWRPSCRYLCCAARNPPSDDSHGINPSCPISPERFHLPLPPPSSAALSFSLSRALAALSSFSFSPRRFSPFFDFSPDPSSALSNQVLRVLALTFPLPGYSFLSFHGHGGVSQEHRSEHNIDPAQPAPAYHHNDLMALHRRW